MTLEVAKKLAEPEMIPVLEEISCQDPTVWIMRQREFPPELARALAETAGCWKKAPAKFGSLHRSGMLYRKESFEQSSGLPAANFKVKLIGGYETADACGGLGFDTLAFLKAGIHCFHNEIQPEISFLARHNHAIHGLQAEYFQEDAATWIKRQPPERLIYLDPSRRTATGEKAHNPEQYSPDPSAILRALPKDQPFLLKLSPLFDARAVFDAFGKHFDVFVVSLDGENREVLALRTPETTGICSAVVLDRDKPEWIYKAGSTENFRPPKTDLYPAGTTIVVPDAALLHSRLHDSWAEQAELDFIGQQPVLYAGNSAPRGAHYAGKLVAECGLSAKKLTEVLRSEGISAARFRFPSRLSDHTALRKALRITEAEGFSILVRKNGTTANFLVCRDIPPHS